MNPALLLSLYGENGTGAPNGRYSVYLRRQSYLNRHASMGSWWSKEVGRVKKGISHAEHAVKSEVTRAESFAKKHKALYALAPAALLLGRPSGMSDDEIIRRADEAIQKARVLGPILNGDDLRCIEHAYPGMGSMFSNFLSKTIVGKALVEGVNAAGHAAEAGIAATTGIVLPPVDVGDLLTQAAGGTPAAHKLPPPPPPRKSFPVVPVAIGVVAVVGIAAVASSSGHKKAA